MKKLFNLLNLGLMAFMMAFVNSACSSSGDDDGGGGDPSIPSSENEKNGLSSSTQEVGMTYVIFEGNVDLSDYSELEQAYMVGYEGVGGTGIEVGIEYGEDLYSMKTTHCSNRQGSFNNVKVMGLKPNTKYYYRTYIEAPYSEVLRDVYGYGKTHTFTTKEASFNGSMTASNAGGTSMSATTINISYNTGGMNSNETYTKGVVYSTSQSDLEASGLYDKFYRACTYSYLKGSGYFKSQYYQEEGQEARFIIVTDEKELTLDVDPGKTYYFCPFIAIGEVAFTGQGGSVKSDEVEGDENFIDLGLSCLWSVNNIGASSPYGPGSQKILDRTLEHNYFKSGERVPTKKEIQELNDKCKIEEQDNGLVITGPNGKKIFIACAGINDNPLNLAFGYPYFGASSGNDASGNTKYDMMFKYDHRTKKFTTENYTTLSTVYIRSVKDKSGSSGGEIDNPDNTGSSADLKTLLTKPMGIIDLDMSTASFTSVKSALEDRYDISSGLSDDGSDYVLVYDYRNEYKYLPSYHGLAFDDFTFSDNQSKRTGDDVYRSIFYSFHINKSEMPDPFVCYDAIINDFKQMGVDLTYKKDGTSIIEARTDLKIKDHKSYSIILYNHLRNGQDWGFDISVKYWGDSHVDSKTASKRDAYYADQVTLWRLHAR